MSACIRTYDKLDYDYAAVARYARCDVSFLPQIEQTVAELGPKFRFSVCYDIFPVVATPQGLDVGVCVTPSASLARYLQGYGYVLVFGATVGLASDTQVLRYGKIQPAKALFADALGVERIETLCDAFCREMTGKTERFSAGYGDLPLEVQRDIFAALPLAKIGMSLGDNLLMTPTKSVTAFVALEKESSV